MTISKYIKSYLRIFAISLVFSLGLVWVICFFNGCPLHQAFAKDGTKIFAWIVVWGNVFLLTACGLSLMMGALPLPRLPGESWKPEQLIVCRYSGLTYSSLSLLSIALGGVMLYGAYLNIVKPGENGITWEAVLVLGVLGAAFAALGSVFILFMKNYMIMFFPEGVFYQNIFKKTYVAAKGQVEYVSIVRYPRKRTMRIHTTDRDLYLNWFCSSYHEAEAYALRQYPDFASYRDEGQ